MAIYNIGSGQQRLRVHAHHRTIHELSWSADGQKLLSVSADGSAKLWRTTPMAGAEGEPLATLLHPSFVFCGKMQPPPQGGRRNSYASPARDSTARDSHPLTRTAAPLSLPQWLVRAPGRPPPSPARPSDPFSHHSLSPRYAVEGLIATGCNDCGLRLWDIATGKLVDQSKKHGARVNACTWNSDGTQVRRHSPPDPTSPARL